MQVYTIEAVLESLITVLCQEEESTCTTIYSGGPGVAVPDYVTCVRTPKGPKPRDPIGEGRGQSSRLYNVVLRRERGSVLSTEWQGCI